MPEMDGFGFLTELHENEVWRHIPIIVLTARDLDQADKSRLDGSVREILQKGAYSRDQLLEQVRSMVADYTFSQGVPAGAQQREEN
jgi:CheY-like chemotaxis protein